MILVDTNVVSEIMTVVPSQAVIGWLNRQDTAALYLSTISIAEISYGLRVLPDGKRQRQLQERFEHFLAAAFKHRILGFDEVAARRYGDVMGHRKEIGRPLSIPDGQIAAIARTNNCTVATRNIRDFEECGVELINPFVLSI